MFYHRTMPLQSRFTFTCIFIYPCTWSFNLPYKLCIFSSTQMITFIDWLNFKWQLITFLFKNFMIQIATCIYNFEEKFIYYSLANIHILMIFLHLGFKDFLYQWNLVKPYNKICYYSCVSSTKRGTTVVILDSLYD